MKNTVFTFTYVTYEKYNFEKNPESVFLIFTFDIT